MTKEFLQSYFNADFKGIDSLLKEVLVPIFGDYEQGWTEITDDLPSKEAAAKANIKRIKHAASLWAGRRILVFDVTLYDDCHIHSSRKQIQTLIRQFVGHFQGALMAFHYENPEGRSWRLSYMEKQETNVNSTSAKRYTYLCGKDYPCRTIAERFAILAGQEKTDMNLEAAFSVEALSDEFFTGYRTLYQEFCDYLTEHRNDATLFGPDFATCEEKYIRDYVKKMMGRITFLHFLQRKGWLGQPRNIDGWGKGDLNFMRHLFEKATDEQKASFLDEVLEPIFFECLNEKRDGDFFDTRVPGIRLVKIPYLNGGLFERDEIDRPRSTFPAEYFDRLFEFFGRYNFTIDENDPLDTEVGVDPEMLGKIFENLLEDNKDKGAFYTPKEIVNYMCREALVAYLVDEARRKSEVNKQRQDNFEAAIRRFVDDPELSVRNMKQYDKQQRIDLSESLSAVKICDPAIGSGAFPMGLLNLLVNCRSALNEALDISMSRANLKKEIIKNNIYGVDIEKGAIDIARLRFWLSIVVDLDEPEPLPNFDYKFMQGNSLLEQYAGVDLSDMFATTATAGKGCGVELIAFEEVSSSQENLKDRLAHYFEVDEGEDKHVLRADVNAAVADLIRAKVNETPEVLEQLKSLDVSANDKFFLWHTWFSEVFERPGKHGFDIVIGNPPYVRVQNLDHALIDLYKKSFKTAFKRLDISTLFIEQMSSKLSDCGILCYISSNQFTSAEYGRLMRKYLIDNHLLKRIVDFADLPVFEKAITYVSIFTITKSDKSSFDYYRVPAMPFVYPENFNKCEYTDFTEEAWSFVFDKRRVLMKKLSSYPLITEIAYAKGGIISGSDECFLFSPNDFPAEKEMSLDVIRTEDIGRYYMGVPNLKVFYPCKLDEDGNTVVLELSEIKSKYPLAYQHIIKNAEAMKNRKDSRITMGEKSHWWQPVRFGTRKLFDGEKILGPGIVCKNKFFIDETGYAFSFGNMYAIVAREDKDIQMRVVLGILNSKLIEFYLHSIAPIKQGGYFSYGATVLEKIPLLYPPKDIEVKIKGLVDLIMAEKSRNSQADTTELEAQIDKLVYQLYDLTPDEIKLIEL